MFVQNIKENLGMSIQGGTVEYAVKRANEKVNGY